MGQVLIVAGQTPWQSQWDLGPLGGRVVRDLPGRDALRRFVAVVLVLDTEAGLIAAVERIRAAKSDSPIAVLVASHTSTPRVPELLESCELDGFVDLDWPAALVRACLGVAVRQVELGKNVVDIQRVVLEQTRRETASLHELAAHDGLTGLYNRRHFLKVLAREHQRSQRGGLSYAVVFVDLDDLKALNIRYGHDGGSMALCELAEALTSLVRGSDVAARFGGDEFVALLVDCDGQGAVRFAERLLDAVRLRRFEIEGELLSITATVGLAVFPHDGESAAEVLSRADHAMFSAKQQGKNRLATAATGPEDLRP